MTFRRVPKALATVQRSLNMIYVALACHKKEPDGLNQHYRASTVYFHLICSSLNNIKISSEKIGIARNRTRAADLGVKMDHPVGRF